MSKVALAVLDQLGVGFSVVDEELRPAVVFGTGNASDTEAVRLRGMASADERKLRAAVASVLGSGPQERAVQGLSLGSETDPSRVLLVPIEVTDGARGSRRLAVLLTIPGGPPDHPEQVIRTMFGLTRVEASIVKFLSDGLAPNDIAARMRMSTNTLRGYMKGIFTKLGVHRQSDLVRMIASTAGLYRPNARPAPSACALTHSLALEAPATLS